MPHTVIFDLDGTLADSRPGVIAAIRYALAGMGHDPDAAGDLTWAVGPPLGQSLRQLLTGFGDDRHELAITLYREEYNARGVFDCKVYPGIAEVLARLRADGKTLYVATSKRRSFAEIMLTHLGLRDRFDAVYGSEPGTGLDEKPALLAHLLAERALDPAAAVMIGDRRFDIEGARANGIAAIGVAWGYAPPGELAACGADRIAAAPAELPELMALLP